MPEEKIKSNLIYFTDVFPANRMLKRLLNRLRKDEVKIFVLGIVDAEGDVEYCWFSKDPTYKALSVTARLQHQINKFLDECEEAIYDD